MELGEFTETAAISPEFANIRYETTAGQYTAELRLHNRGPSTGRQVAVSLGPLPNGVRMLDPSGTDDEGQPYLNMRNAIRSGGLAAGSYSDPVQVSFANLNNVPLIIRPKVLVGPNQSSSVLVTDLAHFGDARRITYRITWGDRCRWRPNHLSSQC